MTTTPELNPAGPSGLAPLRRPTLGPPRVAGDSADSPALGGPGPLRPAGAVRPARPRQAARRLRVPPPQVLAAAALTLISIELVLYHVLGPLWATLVNAALVLLAAGVAAVALLRRRTRGSVSRPGAGRGLFGRGPFGRSRTGGLGGRAGAAGRTGLGRLFGGGRRSGSGLGRRSGSGLGGRAGRGLLSRARKGGAGSGRAGGLGRLFGGRAGRAVGTTGRAAGAGRGGLGRLLGGRRSGSGLGGRAAGATGRRGLGRLLGGRGTAGGGRRGLLGRGSGASSGTAARAGRAGGLGRLFGRRSGAGRAGSGGRAGTGAAGRRGTGGPRSWFGWARRTPTTGAGSPSRPAGAKPSPRPRPGAAAPSKPAGAASKPAGGEPAKPTTKPGPAVDADLVKEEIKAAAKGATAATTTPSGGEAMSTAQQIRAAAEELRAALSSYDPESMRQVVRELPILGQALTDVSDGLLAVANRSESEWPASEKVTEALRNMAKDVKASAGTAETANSTAHKEHETDIERHDAPRKASRAVESKWDVGRGEG